MLLLSKTIHLTKRIYIAKLKFFAKQDAQGDEDYYMLLAKIYLNRVIITDPPIHVLP